MAKEEAMDKEIKFPIEHDRCPACGSKRRVMEVVKEKEVEKGKVRQEMRFALTTYRAAIADPQKTVLSTPVVTSMIDVCADCGCVWSPMTMRDELSMTQVGAPGGDPGGHQFPPHFGRG